jgi:hypothetical protein
MEEYIPENNIFVLFLLIVLTGGLYYFWWLARTCKIFNDDPVANILMVLFTAGMGAGMFYFLDRTLVNASISLFIGVTWVTYLNLRYLYKSEVLNGRESQWFMVVISLFLPLAPLMIQNNINEKFQGR